ncbi:MAG TPA: IclR family transcriptional regulator [Stellaceae bacterium]|nr:IclR family transcriptional regulator [Stellaceae bacterium]
MDIPFRSAEHSETVATSREGLLSVNFILNVIELLAETDGPRALSDIARTLGVSKPRAHRHLRALLQRGYVRQESVTERYEITAKLLALGEVVRDRFEIARLVRPEMARLRDASGLVATASTLIADLVTIVEALDGRMLIDADILPGNALSPFNSAHGLVALAFGPAQRITRAWTGPPPSNPEELEAELAGIRQRGWATAPNRVFPGINALAAPIFDHRGDWRGTIAIVGPTSLVPADPAPVQLKDVLRAAREVSRQLGGQDQ